MGDIMTLEELTKEVQQLKAIINADGTPTPPNVIPIEVSVDLRDIEPGYSDHLEIEIGSNTTTGYLMYGETNGLEWGWLHVNEAPPNQRFRVTFKNIGGHGPVAASCTEWNVNGPHPQIGDAKFLTLSAERDQYSVRVMGVHVYHVARHMALGFITVPR
ncbi:hypothetical protein CN556_11825 [Bacillus wiedmannii]|uniref:hypothetical protein n=1 Tax=Bacillus wiedmannii TaxID=1890302 RepID=UPI000BF22840|nr:hypothetical protein [Bacillus wiedmannii]PEI37719.1 hypothetical protein CN644_06220 [Bacillus wiedmannii]PEL95025.1 hypothetical protein CN604_27425 [Bacillus wiedmannii]PEN96371.1 hypothetical protein CN556_11825 [Bacillus wiedmannii]